MGVNIYLLDRRPARLCVGGVEQSVGSLRRFWKITELNSERSKELEASEATARTIPSPPAAMLSDVYEMPLGSENGASVKAHLVIGWDEGRTSVTDMRWDYLPTLGYGVLDRESRVFVIHEERAGVLVPVSRERATEIGLIGSDNRLVRRGQPTIVECRSVRSYIPGYAEADCTFDDGRVEKLLIGTTGESLPEPSWLVGKKPMHAERYPPDRPAKPAVRKGSPRPLR